jgi:hypothetical protein
MPLWWALLGGGVTALALATLVVLSSGVREHGPSRQSPCIANLHQLALAFRMYAVEHDNRLPPADRWCDALYPSYISRRSGFVCPSRPDLASGYAMNAHLGDLDVRTLAHEDRALLLFESDRGWNASGGPEAAIREPRRDHLGVYCLTIDGRVSSDRGRSRLQWAPDLKPKSVAPATK